MSWTGPGWGRDVFLGVRTRLGLYRLESFGDRQFLGTVWVQMLGTARGQTVRREAGSREEGEEGPRGEARGGAGSRDILGGRRAGA